MTVKTFRTALVLVGLGLSFGTSAKAGFVPLVSGQGSIGGADSAVKVLVGPATGDIASPTFNTATYIAASVVAPNPNWMTSPALSPAQWDSVSPTGSSNSASGATGIYAITFTIASSGSAVLSGLYSVDDQITHIWLGSGTGATGTPTQISGALPGNFSLPTNTLGPIDVSSIVSGGGTFTLYIEDNNQGNVSGLIFNLGITTSAVPEPSSIAMVSIAGLMGAGFYARRKRSIA